MDETRGRSIEEDKSSPGLSFHDFGGTVIDDFLGGKQAVLTVWEEGGSFQARIHEAVMDFVGAHQDWPPVASSVRRGEGATTAAAIAAALDASPEL